jgi:hypothetical protein
MSILPLLMVCRVCSVAEAPSKFSATVRPDGDACCGLLSICESQRAMGSASKVASCVDKPAEHPDSAACKLAASMASPANRLRGWASPMRGSPPCVCLTVCSFCWGGLVASWKQGPEELFMGGGASGFDAAAFGFMNLHPYIAEQFTMHLFLNTHLTIQSDYPITHTLFARVDDTSAFK